MSRATTPVAGPEVRGLVDGRKRRDALLQLEHDALRCFLADAGDGLEERVVLADDRAPQLGRRVAGDDCESDLRADAGDGEQLLEELALGGFCEAEELERVLADVQVRLDDHLVGAVGLANRGRRRAAGSRRRHVEDESVRVVDDRLPAQARDHPRLRASASSGGASAWQMATASASAAWCGRGVSESPSTAFTMRCT